MNAGGRSDDILHQSACPFDYADHFILIESGVHWMDLLQKRGQSYLVG